MGYFSQTAKAAAAGRTIRASQLAFFDFKSGAMSVHPGFGPLVAGGQTWNGLGELGAVSGLESPLGGSAPKVTFTLSGVSPTLVAAALAAPDEVKNRRATVFLQFFDDGLAPLDAPYVLAQLTMDVLTLKATGPGTRTAELSAETVWVRQDVAPWGYLSDRSQQARYPGDNGLDQVPLMQNRSVNWPVF